MTKLDPIERQSMIFELEMKTNYSRDYLDTLSNEEILRLYKEKCL